MEISLWVSLGTGIKQADGNIGVKEEAEKENIKRGMNDVTAFHSIKEILNCFLISKS